MNLKIADFLHLLPSAAYVCDASGIILSFNEKAAQLWGRAPKCGSTEELFCGSYRIYYPDGTFVPRDQTPMAQVLKTGQTIFDKEAIVERPGGSRVHCSVSIAPIMEDGRILGAINCFQDVTERVSRQAEILEKNEELYRLNEKLRLYNDELEQFAYVSSHDLQEPLRMIAAFTDLLEEKLQDHADEEIHSYLKFSKEGALRAKNLINSLLEYARTQASPSSFTEIDAAEAVRKAVDNLALSVANTDARVLWDPLPVIFGDEIRLTQLFQNLIGNALKFRREGAAPEVRISAARSPDGDWIFAVKDNGIGIPEEQQKKIFGIFYRAHARGKYPGMGIGLSIAKKIVSIHQGRIWVESEPEQGTAFYFSIPGRETRMSPGARIRRTAAGDRLAQAAAGDHVVRIFQDEAEQADAAVSFADAGLRQKESVVFISARRKWPLYKERLENAGCGLLMKTGELRLFFAEDWLDFASAGEDIDLDILEQKTGNVLRETAAQQRKFRVLSETGSLLFDMKKYDELNRIEKGWSKFSEKHQFPVFSPYLTKAGTPSEMIFDFRKDRKGEIPAKEDFTS